MAKVIQYVTQQGNRPQKLAVEVTDEVAAFLEQDKRREAAQQRSDRRHLSKGTEQSWRRPRISEPHKLENEVLHNIRVQAVLAAIQDLPCEEQDLLHAYYWQEKSMEQIGQDLGISKMAVSKRLKKLRNKLRGSVF